VAATLSSVMKLWVEPESNRAWRVAPPMVIKTFMVSLDRTLAMAWREMRGTSPGASVSAGSPSSYVSSKSSTKRCE
jgi:hypothetical protein